MSRTPRPKSTLTESADADVDVDVDVPSVDVPTAVLTADIVVVPTADESAPTADTTADTTDVTTADVPSTDVPTAVTTADVPTAAPAPSLAELIDACVTAGMAAIESADPATGTVPLAALDAMVAAYRAIPATGKKDADKSGRSRAVALLNGNAATYYAPRDPTRLAALAPINAAFTAAADAPAAPAAPTVDAAATLRGLLASAALLTLAARGSLAAAADVDVDAATRDAAFAMVPTDVDGAATADAFGLAGLFGMAELVGAPLPRVGAVKSAGKRSTSTSTTPRIGGGAGGKRADITRHVNLVAAAHDVGTLLTAEEVRAFATDECPDGAKSVGAVSNAIDRGGEGWVAIDVPTATRSVRGIRVSR
jgi:hypothetical protein